MIRRLAQSLLWATLPPDAPATTLRVVPLSR